MINVKAAVAAAEEFARSLYPDTELRHLRLEEVELSGDDRHWLVTLGWVEPAISGTTVSVLTGVNTLQKLPRVYKTFKVDAGTGDVRSMMIRNVS